MSKHADGWNVSICPLEKMDKNAERDRVRQRGLGRSSQDPEEERVWMRLASDISSMVSRSNQDFTVTDQSHGNKQTQNI